MDNSKKKSIYKKRLNSLKESLCLKKFDAIIVTNLNNIFYLTGFTGTAAFLVVFAGGAKDAFFTDSRYDEQAHKEVCSDIKIDISITLIKNISKNIKQKKVIKRLAVENSITIEMFNNFKKYLSPLKIKPASNVVEEIRIIKSSSEIKSIQKAIDVTQKALGKVIKKIKPGVKEYDLAVNLEYEMKKFGAQKTAFDTIIASGARSAMPHAKVSLRVLKKGDPVIIDCGCRLDGYNSDLTRTYFLDRISPKFKRSYEDLLEAQEMVIENIKPGVLAKDLDLFVREKLAKRKLDKYFTHSLGHGLGICVHEVPTISFNSDFVLKEGMVFTIEPGVYFSRYGGIRIEDDVVVTKDGCRVLSTLPKKLENIVIK